MNNIGIIAAMDEEMIAIKNLMSNINESTYFERVFSKTKLKPNGFIPIYALPQL